MIDDGAPGERLYWFLGVVHSGDEAGSDSLASTLANLNVKS